VDASGRAPCSRLDKFREITSRGVGDVGLLITIVLENARVDFEAVVAAGEEEGIAVGIFVRPFGWRFLHRGRR
jgi:hypothetical protein